MAPTGFYGWHVVAYAAIALAATGPGQTVGISLFVDPLIDDLGISRAQVSTAYLIGTLGGTVALPWIGRVLDRFGIRRTMAVIGAVFGAVLIGISFATSVLGLTAGFVGLRMAGQGALGLTATTAVALWFHHRRGMAAGIVSAIGALGISATPLLLEYYLLDLGWRTAWRIEGLAIWAIVIPVALLGMRDRPADLGQHPDGPVAAGAEPPPAAGSVELTRAQTLRQPYFWLIATAVALSGLLTTAVSFHQISTALWWGTFVSPGMAAFAFGIMLGAAGSIIRAVEATSLPRAFGTRHIGSIRGLVASISVAGTACGPLLFATAAAATGSYSPVLLASAAVPLLVAGWGVIAREPVLEQIAPPQEPPASLVEQPSHVLERPPDLNPRKELPCRSRP